MLLFRTIRLLAGINGQLTLGYSLFIRFSALIVQL